jgi:hypothetical protein
MSFREMVLIPVEEYKRHMNQLSINNKTATIQNDIRDINEQYGDTIPDDQRLKLESAVITKHKGDFKQPIPEPQQNLFLRMIDSFPKANQKRSLQVFNHLVVFFKQRPKWNDLGQILNSNNEPIIGSNIIELIDSVTTIKSARIPAIGFDQFTKYLQEANMPRNFLSLPGIRKIDKQDEMIYDDNSPAYVKNRFGDSSFTTPSKWDSLS